MKLLKSNNIYINLSLSTIVIQLLLVIADNIDIYQTKFSAIMFLIRRINIMIVAPIYLVILNYIFIKDVNKNSVLSRYFIMIGVLLMCNIVDCISGHIWKGTLTRFTDIVGIWIIGLVLFFSISVMTIGWIYVAIKKHKQIHTTNNTNR